jgi:hypothetical protein
MRFVAPFFGIALLLVSAGAFAGARQHFLAGQDYYSQGRYQKAIEEFEEAYRLDPRPLLLYNMAQAYEKLGELEKAVKSLKQYLDKEKEVDDRATLLNKVANLESRIASTGIKVDCNQDDAAIYIDGQEMGKTPLNVVIKLPVGTHKLRVIKPGFEDFKVTVSVASGRTVSIEAELEPGQAGPLPVVDTSTDDGEGDEEVKEDDEGPGKALKIVPWVVAGVGAVTMGVGWGVIGAIAWSNTETDEGKKQSVIADVVGFSGVAITLAGGIWGVVNLLSDDEEEQGAEVVVLPAAGPDGAGVVASVRF